jgi:NADH dehydrogenase
MQQKKKIVTVGGGFASVKLALELSKNDAFDITLISPHDQLEYHGALYRSATGRSPLEVVLPFREIFKDIPNVTLVNDLLTDLRAQTKDIKGLSGQVYPYDALVLGIGYEKEYFGTRGAREHCETMYTIFDTIALRNKMRDVFIKKQGQECRIVVVGAGPTGLEVAGDVQTFVDIVADKYGVAPVKPKVTVIDRAEKPLPMLKKETSEAVLHRLKQLNVDFMGGVGVDHCTSRHISLIGGAVLPADILIWTAGSRANSFFERYPDIFTLDPKKRVLTNEYMQASSPDIYVLGDAASTQYTGMAQTAITDAIQLADNFKRYVNGEELKQYEPKLPVYVVPLGHEWAVAQDGEKVIIGADGWKVRRDADYYVLSNFLPEQLAKEHWEKAFQIAHI